MNNDQDLKKFSKEVTDFEDLHLYTYIDNHVERSVLKVAELISSATLDEGGIVFVTGPVNSGKSIFVIKLHEELIRNRDRHIAVGQPDVDRNDILKGKIFSRKGLELEATPIKTKKDIETMFHDNSVVIIDEIHFMPQELQIFFMKEVMEFVDRGGWFVSVGVLYTSQRGEFLLPALLKERSLLNFEFKATCQMCGRRDADQTQRMIDGLPAKHEQPDFMPPSSSVSYEPRCKNCIV